MGFIFTTGIIILGCVRPLPPSAQIIFVSNMDSATRANEIYSMDENGGNITQITYSHYRREIIGIDKTKRYIIATRVGNDTNPPAGLGNEDRKSLWILDLETGDERRLTEPANNAEGNSFSPNGEWIVFEKPMHYAGENGEQVYGIYSRFIQIEALSLI
ncbi:MAG: hypothetical protein J7J36_03235 [Thermoplasmata archaeon]|nr:hypothetical protein [Thermoplasmata archaeon]